LVGDEFGQKRSMNFRLRRHARNTSEGKHEWMQ
jgi:hypothetical protein